MCKKIKIRWERENTGGEVRERVWENEYTANTVYTCM
jgi:hypothetical protein